MADTKQNNDTTAGQTDADKPDISKTELFVTVRDAEHVIFEGKAISLSTANAYGYFDILPRHKNFITNIEEKLIIHTSATEKQELTVDSGILRIFNNVVDIFLGINTLDIETVIANDKSGPIM